MPENLLFWGEENGKGFIMPVAFYSSGRMERAHVTDYTSLVLTRKFHILVD